MQVIFNVFAGCFTMTELENIKDMTCYAMHVLEQLAKNIEELNDDNAIIYKTWLSEEIKTRPFVPITATASIRVSKIKYTRPK